MYSVKWTDSLGETLQVVSAEHATAVIVANAIRDSYDVSSTMTDLIRNTSQYFHVFKRGDVVQYGVLMFRVTATIPGLDCMEIQELDSPNDPIQVQASKVIRGHS